MLVRVDKQDIPARQLKAAALHAIGYATANTNWRGFYLTSALELEGKVDPGKVLAGLSKASFTPDKMTTAQLFNVQRFYVDAETIKDKHLKIGFNFSDTKEQFTLQIRNSILDIHTELLADKVATLTLSRDTLNKTFTKETSYANAIAEGLISIDGSKLALFSYAKAFDMEAATPYLSLQ